jgi:hypothetical protein
MSYPLFRVDDQVFRLAIQALAAAQAPKHQESITKSVKNITRRQQLLTDDCVLMRTGASARGE